MDHGVAVTGLVVRTVWFKEGSEPDFKSSRLRTKAGPSVVVTTWIRAHLFVYTQVRNRGADDQSLFNPSGHVNKIKSV